LIQQADRLVVSRGIKGRFKINNFTINPFRKPEVFPMHRIDRVFHHRFCGVADRATIVNLGIDGESLNLNIAPFAGLP
jgi:hypothetical protein